MMQVALVQSKATADREDNLRRGLEALIFESPAVQPTFSGTHPSKPPGPPAQSKPRRSSCNPATDHRYRDGVIESFIKSSIDRRSIKTKSHGQATTAAVPTGPLRLESNPQRNTLNLHRKDLRRARHCVPACSGIPSADARGEPSASLCRREP